MKSIIFLFIFLIIPAAFEAYSYNSSVIINGRVILLDRKFVSFDRASQEEFC